MKAIKKISVTPVQSYIGQIIDSMTTSSNKHTNAPSIDAVENFVNGKVINNTSYSGDKTIVAPSYNVTEQKIAQAVQDALQTSHTSFIFKDTTNAKTYTANAYKSGKVVTIYFDFNIQALESVVINTTAIPSGYRPKHTVSMYFGENSTYANWITLNLSSDGKIAGTLNGADNESGSYLRDYPSITYVIE